MKKVKKECAGNWKMMSLEDKVLFTMENICYLLVICTLITTIIVINKVSIIGTGILIFSTVGFFGCGLSARSSRDCYLYMPKLSLKVYNKSADKLLKLN